ncbi:TRAP transporter substrate-binding protein [Azospirillum sp. ST 5-10]|uniref:TRAP transporter substrate-binding protein n=1 Tax=unclassified Azospirillum TaxID=2630922 RepID=UPI003F4A6F62
MLSKRRLLSTIAALACGAALSLATGAAAAAEHLRLAGNFPVDHTASQAMEIFKTEFEAATNGAFTVDLFPAMQLGGAQENVDQVRSGTIFGVVTSIAYFTRTVPEYEAVSLPFLFDSREDAFRVMDGEAGQLFDAKMAEKGFVNLGYGELGFRHATNNVRPLESADDFKGLKIRLQPNEVHLETFRALGANPIAMDVKELYAALQQGVLDGQENPYNIIATRRFNEVQKHLSNSGHFYDFINVVVNKRQFEKLSPETQTAMRAAMRKAMLWQREEAAKRDDGWRQELIKSGMVFTPITDETRAALRKATASVVDGVKKRVDPKVVDMVLAEAAQ